MWFVLEVLTDYFRAGNYSNWIPKHVSLYVTSFYASLGPCYLWLQHTTHGGFKGATIAATRAMCNQAYLAFLACVGCSIMWM